MSEYEVGCSNFLICYRQTRHLQDINWCRLAWTRYLGIGKGRLERCKRSYHGIDDRTINQGSLAAVFD